MGIHGLDCFGLGQGQVVGAHNVRKILHSPRTIRSVGHGRSLSGNSDRPLKLLSPNSKGYDLPSSRKSLPRPI